MHMPCILLLCCKFQIIILKTEEAKEKAKFLSNSRVWSSNNKIFDQSSVTFIHMPSLYSYFAASLKSLSWKLYEKLRKHEPYYAMCIRQNFEENPGYVTLAIKIW